MSMTRHMPAAINSVLGAVAELASACRAKRRRRRATIEPRTALQACRCFAEIAAPLFKERRRGNLHPSGTAQCLRLRCVAEFGGGEGEQL